MAKKTISPFQVVRIITVQTLRNILKPSNIIRGIIKLDAILFTWSPQTFVVVHQYKSVAIMCAMNLQWSTSIGSSTRCTQNREGARRPWMSSLRWLRLRCGTDASQGQGKMITFYYYRQWQEYFRSYEVINV